MANVEGGNVTVFSEGVTFNIKTGRFDDISEELVQQLSDQRDDIEFEAGTLSVTLPQGVTGVGTEVFGVETSSGLFAFTYEGVEVDVEDPPNVSRGTTQQIADMINRIRFTEIWLQP